MNKLQIIADKIMLHVLPPLDDNCLTIRNSTVERTCKISQPDIAIKSRIGKILANHLTKKDKRFDQEYICGILDRVTNGSSISKEEFDNIESIVIRDAESGYSIIESFLKNHEDTILPMIQEFRFDDDGKMYVYNKENILFENGQYVGLSKVLDFLRSKISSDKALSKTEDQEFVND